ncbi:MAG: hypothetical protein RR446_02340 [Lachnospiraceae bacterium]
MKAKNLVVLALMTTILLIAQVGLAVIPNVELVSLLIIIYTQLYRKQVFYIIYAFALLEGLLYGFGLWWIMYLYVWTILAGIILWCGNQLSTAMCAVLSGIFGLFFGLLCSIPYAVVGGWQSALGYWIAGIPFDIIHCVGNVIVAAVLYKPIKMILGKLVQEHEGQLEREKSI